jgi:hypothetical protein
VKHSLLILVLAFGLVSCSRSAPSVPPGPNSAQTQALHITQTLADAVNAATRVTVTLNGQAKVSDADTRTVLAWSKSAVALDEQLATELGGADPWPTQRQKIAASLAGFRLPAGGFPPELQQLFAQTQVIVQQLLAQVSP